MAAEPAVYAFGPFVLDRHRRQLVRDGSAVALTPKAFDLLTVLVENDGRLVTKQALMDTLWPDTAVEENNLTFQISTLRKALGDGRYVVTVPGQGYQFAGVVERVTETETVVEQEERTTVTVSDERRTWPVPAIAIAAALVVSAIVAFFVIRKNTPPPAAGVRSIAVLPFRPIVASERDESLELGMADTLITRLSHVPSIVVRPTSAVRRYTALDQDPVKAGRDLGVDAVLDGSIQRRGDRIRVTVRLLRVSDGQSLWATQFYQHSRDLFDLQDSVADGVARSIVPSLSGREQQMLTRKTTDDLEAYSLYTKGLYATDRNPPQAIELFQSAVARDPKFAAAWAAIADTWLHRGRFTNTSPQPFAEQARIAVQKALALDPELADAHSSHAAILADYDWKWDEAEREYRRALELNPNYAVAHNGYAVLLVFRHKFDAALAHSRRAAELDPLSPMIGVTRGMVLRYAGRNEEAIRSLRDTLKLHPKLSPVLLHLGMATVGAGRAEEGMQILKDALPLARNNSQMQALYAFAAAKAGHRDEALLMLRKLEALSAKENVAAMNIAIAWTALGDRDRAFHWLERAYRDHLYLLRVVTVEPGFEPLRKDPRYAQLLARLGLAA